MAYYHDYGIKYFGSFSSIPINNINSITYDIIIKKKNYSDVVTPLVLASSPAIHTYLQDEARPGIKGSELSVSILNIDNTMPLKNFYSENDDEFKVELIEHSTNKTLFIGYLIQTDCQEIETDIAHEIKLVFSDQLALLKGIPFNDAINKSYFRYIPYGTGTKPQIFVYNGVIEFPDPSFYNNYGNLVITDLFTLPDPVTEFTLQPGCGMVIEINGKTIGSYKITRMTSDALSRQFYLDQQPPILSNLQFFNCRIYFINSMRYYEAYSLGNIITACLLSTGVKTDYVYYIGSLQVKNFSSVKTDDLLNTLMIDVRSFYESNKWESTYDVLRKIMELLGATIFQANGNWYIVRYNELMYYNNNIPYIRYGIAFNYIDQGSNIIKIRDIGIGNDIEYGLNSSIIRPYNNIILNTKFEQYNEIFLNERLDKLGAFITASFGPTETIRDYEIPYIYTEPVGTTKITLRKVTDVNNKLLNKYIHVDGEGMQVGTFYKFSNALHPIIVEKGDKFKLSFEVKYLAITPRPFPPTLYATITVGTWYLSNIKIGSNEETPTYWIQQNRSFRKFLDIENTDFISIDIDASEIPESGELIIDINALDNTNFSDFRNFDFNYQPYYSGKLYINGQYHSSNIYFDIKNNTDVDYYIDNTSHPNLRNSIYLYNSAKTNRKYPSVFYEGISNFEYSLGQIIIGQEHNWRNKARLKYEGTILSATIDSNISTALTPLFVFKYMNEVYKNFIIGKCDINYKENLINNITLYEMWDSVEDADSITNGIRSNEFRIYNFDYSYNEK